MSKIGPAGNYMGAFPGTKCALSIRERGGGVRKRSGSFLIYLGLLASVTDGSWHALW